MFRGRLLIGRGMRQDKRLHPSAHRVTEKVWLEIPAPAGKAAVAEVFETGYILYFEKEGSRVGDERGFEDQNEAVESLLRRGWKIIPSERETIFEQRAGDRGNMRQRSIPSGERVLGVKSKFVSIEVVSGEGYFYITLDESPEARDHLFEGYVKRYRVNTVKDAGFSMEGRNAAGAPVIDLHAYTNSYFVIDSQDEVVSRLLTRPLQHVPRYSYLGITVTTKG